MNLKKTILYVLLISILAFVEFSFFEYPNRIVDTFFGFVLLLFIVFIVNLVSKDVFKEKRWFYFLLIIIPILTFLLIEGYRNYFLIATQSSESNIQKGGKSKDITVFGTGHQRKLFEMIIEGEDINFSNSQLSPNWNYDTIWIYYNYKGEIEESLNSPKKMSYYYFYSKEITIPALEVFRD